MDPSLIVAAVCGGLGTLIGAASAAAIAWSGARGRERRDDFSLLLQSQQAVIEQLRREVNELKDEHTSCREENAALKDRVVALEAEIKRLKIIKEA